MYGEKAAFIGLSSGRSTFYLRDLLDRLEVGDYSDDRAPYYVVVDSFPVSAGYGKPKLKFLALADATQPSAYEVVFEASHGARIFKRIAPGETNRQ